MQFGRETANVLRNDNLHGYPDISINLSGSSETLLLPLKLDDIVIQKSAILLSQGTAGKNIHVLVARFVYASKE